MVTRAIIEQKIDKNSVRVRIPITDRIQSSAYGTNTNNLNIARICTLPSFISQVNIGDAVFVAFEDNDFGKPVIIGYLQHDRIVTKGDMSVLTLSADIQAILPENTQIGETTSKDIKNLYGTSGNIQKQIDILNQIVTQINSDIKSIPTTGTSGDYDLLIIDGNETTILVKRDTAENLSGKVLKSGEFAYATNTKQLKIGDGSTEFSQLQDIGSGGSGGTDTNTLYRVYFNRDDQKYYLQASNDGGKTYSNVDGSYEWNHATVYQFDPVPTKDSINLVNSGVIYTAIDTAKQDVLEVAEGKTKSYVVSADDYADFKSSADSITISQDFYTNDGVIHSVNDLHIGDIFYVIETDYCDRWVSAINTGSATLHKLETVKVPVTDVKVDNQTILSNTVANINTKNSNYNSNTNKLITESDISNFITSNDLQLYSKLPKVVSFTVNSTEWLNVPVGNFNYVASKNISASDYTVTDKTIIELINDNISKFSKYGFQIEYGSGSSQQLIFYSLEQPTQNITFKVVLQESV